jgi:hypothetical protein
MISRAQGLRDSATRVVGSCSVLGKRGEAADHLCKTKALLQGKSLVPSLPCTRPLSSADCRYAVF